MPAPLTERGAGIVVFVPGPARVALVQSRPIE
jgi:hypothetical protein